MTELYFEGEDRCTSTNAPRNQWFGEPPILQSFANFVFISSPNLTQQNQHFNLRVIIVTEKVIHEACPRVPIASNSNTLVNTISRPANDVVQLIRHPPGFTDISHTSRSVKLAHNNIIKHSSSISYSHAAWFDTTDRCWAYQPNPPAIGLLYDLTCLALRNTLGNYCNSFNLRRKLQCCHCCLMDRTKRRKVNHNGDISVPFQSFLNAGVNRHQFLTLTPIKLDIMVAPEREDHSSNAWLGSVAHVIKIQHSLHRPILQAVNNSFC
mmetsp:Transcript_9088/g.13593  ORF Transcript_9088/g.13593 Transcript_9088/m.13593 type:complete len:266 (+) Transcript_9088:1068-1865(+)